MLKKALLKSLEIDNKDYKYTVLKIHKISYKPKIFDHSFDGCEYNINNISDIFHEYYRIHSVIKHYLKLKEKIWFNESCYLIFKLLRNILGKDITFFYY